jgi:hypothetical protein
MSYNVNYDATITGENKVNLIKLLNILLKWRGEMELKYIVKNLTNRGNKIGVHHLFFIICANEHYPCSYKH